MTCQVFQQRLGELLDGALDPCEREPLLAHAGACADCAELLALGRNEPASFAADAPPELAGAILRSTVGSTCARAHGLLCDLVDDALDPLDSELARLHVSACRDCTALVAALHALGRDLPTMACASPGATFARDVVARTSAARPRRTPLLGRLEALWAGMLSRPRIAWEAGYVGALAVWLISGGNLASIGQVSADALLAVQDGVSAAVRAPAETLPAGMDEVGALASDLADRGRQNGEAWWRDVRAAANARIERLPALPAADEAEARARALVERWLGDDAPATEPHRDGMRSTSDRHENHEEHEENDTP